MSDDNKPIQGEEHQDLLREVRHLKDTIAALREALDVCQDDMARAEQRVRAESATEKSQEIQAAYELIKNQRRGV